MSSIVRRGIRKLGGGRPLGVVNDLVRLVGLYGGTDKGEHGYLPYYERHFARLRLQRQTVLEIGVGGYDSLSPSGSLRIWRDYFVRSSIVGFDIEQKVVNLGPRVSFMRGDQSDATALGELVANHGVPTVVIDDGSHIGRHIRASFDLLWPRLPSGAIYVIEDLSTSYYPDFEGGSPAPPDSGVGLLQVLTDSVQALDPTFADRPELGSREAPAYPDVAAVSIYPGIAFVEKA